MAKYMNEVFDGGFHISERTVNAVPIHWHSYYEVEFCMSGKGIQLVNGIPTPYKKGTLTFLSPNDFHRIELIKGPFQIITFCFYAHILSANMINFITENKPPFCLQLSGEDYDRMMWAYRTLESEYKKNDVFHDRSLKYQIGLICIDVIRKTMEKRKTNAVSTKRADASHYMLENALSYINAHYAEKLTRNEMAARLHLTPSYFSELFKKRLGISYSDYITDLRMSHAMRLLKYTNDPISEIMLAVGYNSSSAFYEQFKEYYKILPGDVNRAEDE